MRGISLPLSLSLSLSLSPRFFFPPSSYSLQFYHCTGWECSGEPTVQSVHACMCVLSPPPSPPYTFFWLRLAEKSATSSNGYHPGPGPANSSILRSISCVGGKSSIQISGFSKTGIPFSKLIKFIPTSTLVAHNQREDLNWEVFIWEGFSPEHLKWEDLF